MNLSFLSLLLGLLCSLFSCNGFDHVRLIATLRTRSWVNILEPFKLEFLLGFSRLIFLSNGVVSMELRIGHSDSDGTLALRPLVLPALIADLEHLLGIFTVSVLHHAADRCLRSVWPTVGHLSCR